MSILQKSGENFKAVDLLLLENLSTPVIHCAYYSSLQLIIHFVYNYCNLSEQQIRQRTNQNSSHTFYIGECVKEIKRLDSRNAVLFYKYFTIFKKIRTDSDYDNAAIVASNSIKAKEKVIKIRKFFKLIEDEGKCKNIHYI